MTTPDHHNFSGINHKKMKINDLPDKEFKVAVLRNLNELQENI